MSEFYYEGINPETDYLVATKEDAYKSFGIAKDVKAKVDVFVPDSSVVLQKLHGFE